MATPPQFSGKHRLIDTLEQAWPELPMQQERCIDDIGRRCLKRVHLRAFAPLREPFFFLF
jgi:hypothetical protein